MTRFCRNCGEELITVNEYTSKKRHNLGRICKNCHIKEMKKRYHSKKKLFFITTNNICIFFETRQDKIEFLSYRNMMKKLHKVPLSHSSNVGCTIDEIVEIDGNYTLQRLTCDECKSILRYDKNGYKVCEYCGLIH